MVTGSTLQDVCLYSHCGVLGNPQLHVSLPDTRYDMETCLSSEPARWRVCSGSCQPPECSRTYITGHGKGLRRKWLPLEKKTGEAGCRVRVPLTQIPVPLRTKGKKKERKSSRDFAGVERPRGPSSVLAPVCLKRLQVPLPPACGLSILIVDEDLRANWEIEEEEEKKK